MKRCVRLREERIRRGLRQRDIAGMLHISGSYYAMIEQGRYDPSWAYWHALERIFGISGEELKKREEEEVNKRRVRIRDVGV